MVTMTRERLYSLLVVSLVGGVLVQVVAGSASAYSKYDSPRYAEDVMLRGNDIVWPAAAFEVAPRSPIAAFKSTTNELLQGASYGPYCLGPNGEYGGQQCFYDEDNAFVRAPAGDWDPVGAARNCSNVLFPRYPLGRGYYDAYRVEIPTGGQEWTFTTSPNPNSFDSITYLYKSMFDPGYPCQKLIAASYMSANPGGNGERITVRLREAGVYFLVISHMGPIDDPQTFGTGLYSLTIDPTPGSFQRAIPNIDFTPSPQNDIGALHHDWLYPFCRGQVFSQPYIAGVFDHELPTQGSGHDNNSVLPYVNRPAYPPCQKDPNKPWLNYWVNQTNCLMYDGHNGWDYTDERTGSYYQGIYAPADGTVEWTGYERPWGCFNDKVAYGDISTGPLEIELDHGDVESWYAHMSAVYVQPGQYVHQGQEIGLGGITGRPGIDFSHLHFMATVETGEAGFFGDHDMFDPYGWAITHFAPPLNDDPADVHGHPASRRLMVPFAGDNTTQCIAGDCGGKTSRRIVDDSMLCTDPMYANGDCFTTNTGWNEDINHGLPASTAVPRRNLHDKQTDYKVGSVEPVRWTFRGLAPAVYEVSVYIPNGGPLRTATRAARYTLFGADSTVHPANPEIVLDQFENNARFGVKDSWLVIGHYRLSGDVSVELSDAAYIGAPDDVYVEPNQNPNNLLVCRASFIVADAVAVSQCPSWQAPPGIGSSGGGN